MNTLALIHALEATFPEPLESMGYAYRGVGRCLVSSRVGIEVLRRFGVPAEPIPVVVRAANKVYFDFAARALKGEKLRARTVLRAGGKLVEIDIESRGPGTGWPGHMVVGVRHEGVSCFIDLDSIQFNRPAHKLVVPRTLVVAVPPEWFEAGVRAVGNLGQGAKIEYQRLAHFESWEHSNDWAREDRWGPIVRRIVKKIHELDPTLDNPPSTC